MKVIKTALALTILSITFTACVTADKMNVKKKLPFIGKKYFNFYGGTGTQQTIEINKDGTTTVMLYGVDSSGIMYKGDFSDSMKSVEGDEYHIKGNKIYLLKNGKIKKGCMEDDNMRPLLCIAPLEKI